MRSARGSSLLHYCRGVRSGQSHRVLAQHVVRTARAAIRSTEMKQHAFANTTNNNAAYRERSSLACFDLHNSRLLGNARLTAIFRRTFSLIGTLSVQEIRKCPLNEATTLLGFGPTRRSRVVLSVRCPRAAPRRYSFAKRPVTFRGDSYG